MATELLKQAITRIEELPPSDQDALAGRMLTELDAIEEAEEAEWDALLASPALQRLSERFAVEVQAAKADGTLLECDDGR